MKTLNYIVAWTTISIVSLLSVGCGQNVDLGKFEDTRAENMARAVILGDVEGINRSGHEDPSILDFVPKDGRGLLVESIVRDQFASLEALLKLGADPDIGGPLIYSFRLYGDYGSARLDTRFARELLDFDASLDYVLNNVSSVGSDSLLTYLTPPIKAATADLEYVRILSSYGADFNRKTEPGMESPLSSAIRTGKYDIAEYLIDSLNVSLEGPVRSILNVQGENERLYFIQDISTTDQTRRYLKDQSYELDSSYIEELRFIEKLQSLGIDFDNYEYR